MEDQQEDFSRVINNYFRFVFYTGVLLTVSYIAVLIRIWKGSKYTFLYGMSLMLMTSNIFAITADAFQKPWIEDSTKVKPYLYLQVMSSFMRDMLFNLAHWIFCYKYWIIAIEMQSLLEAKPISQS